MSKYEYYTILQPGWGYMVSHIVAVVSKQGFHTVFSMIIKRQKMNHKVTRCHSVMAECIIVYAVFSVKINSLFTWKVEWPSDNFGSVSPSALTWYSPNTGTKWMDLLIVQCSYCNTICSMAGCQGVCHQFDCADWISMLSLFFPTSKSYFVASWESKT